LTRKVGLCYNKLRGDDLIIEFHAHILARTDHGCKSSAMALEQLRLMKRYGTDAVVATPHFYPNQDSVESFLDAREGAISAMLKKLPMEELPTVYPAAEVLACEGIHKMKDLEALAVAGTRVILVEMPFTNWSDTLLFSVLGIRERGLCPVLAHIDRYSPERIRPLLDEGMLAQLNAEAFRLFGKGMQYLPLVKKGQVVALGSDLHEAKAGDYARFVKAQKKLGDAAHTVFAATAKLLENAVPITEQKERVSV
jgi:protein-tyrosine phosphatase